MKVHRISLVSGQSFPSEERESILDAALRAGVALEHSCRTGRCSSCKSQVVQGDTLALTHEAGLSAAEHADHWILACARSASSDILVDAPVLSAALPKAKLTPAKIDSLVPLADDVLQVRLRFPPNSPLQYRAGQYVDVAQAGHLKRSYSIANVAPDTGATAIDLHIRKVPGGAMSDYWFSRAKPGDLLRVDGPRGTFFLRDAPSRDLLLLATGTGIAPIKALLEGLARQPPSTWPDRIVLMWGNRHPADFYLDPKSWGIPLDYQPVLSGAAESWAHQRGRITAHLPTDAGALAQTTVYACGSPQMIDDARACLMQRGLPQGQFHADAFVCSI